MLNVVSNTTPIISLLKLNRLEILKELYGQINIPLAVYQEVEAGKNKNTYKDLSKFDWIKILKIKNRKSLKYFLELDSGESESIVLATETNADLLIIDERLGRYYAKNAELNITGTIGVLLKAKNLGIVTNIKPILNELMDNNIWLSKNLVIDILKQTGET